MKVYTYQIGKWRQLRGLGIPLMDTTVKSGDKRLAPTWAMVLGIKRGILSKADYAAQYRELLEASYQAHPKFWQILLASDSIAFGCYCKPGQFCHRYLLVKFLKTLQPLEYRGELLPGLEVQPIAGV